MAQAQIAQSLQLSRIGIAMMALACLLTALLALGTALARQRSRRLFLFSGAVGLLLVAALAMPAASPRRRVNQGCTQPMAGV